MMIHQSHPTVHIPPWPLMDAYPVSDEESDTDPSDPPLDLYSSDEFRMYEFKIRRCARGRSHDWTDCPYAHPGEKARRRDPRKYSYSGTPCPDYKKGGCKKGDGCDYAHGVFECWLHPSRYRTQPCKDGTACRRRVCFFAHTPDQLRVSSPRSMLKVLDSYDGSPMRLLSSSSKRTTTTTVTSPPMSPGSEYGSPMSPDGLAVWLRKMRLGGGRMGSGSGFGGGCVPRKEVMTMMMMRKGFPEMEEEEEEEPDFGWVSELVK